MVNILIIDAASATPLSASKELLYSQCVAPKEATLFLITSPDRIKKDEQKKYKAVVELKSIFKTGLLELIAKAWHDKYTIHEIYCKDKALLTRIAHLRVLLNIKTGLQPSHSFLLQNKHLIKQIAAESGFPVPKFKLLNSPCCLLSFVEEHGFPVIVKPMLTSASANSRVLRTQQHVVDFLSNDYFALFDTQGSLSTNGSGSYMVESYLDANMYQVIGFMDHGQLTFMWAFQSLGTSLGFTKGIPLGHLSLITSDPEFHSLTQATQLLLSYYSWPSKCVFQINLFKLSSSMSSLLLNPPTSFLRVPKFALCNLTMSGPSNGSLPLLITDLLRSSNPLMSAFEQLDFRFQCGLSIPTQSVLPTIRVGEVLLPNRPYSILTYIPPNSSFPFASYVEYQPFVTSGFVYERYTKKINHLRARLVTRMEANDSKRSVWMALLDASQWVESQCTFVEWMKHPSGFTQQVMKLHKRTRQFQRGWEHKRHAFLQVSRIYKQPSFTLLRKLISKPDSSTALVLHRNPQTPWTRLLSRCCATPSTSSQALIRTQPWMKLQRRIWLRTRHGNAFSSSRTSSSLGSSPTSSILLPSPPTSCKALIAMKDLKASKFHILNRVHAAYGKPEWKDGKKYVWISSPSSTMVSNSNYSKSTKLGSKNMISSVSTSSAATRRNSKIIYL